MANNNEDIEGPDKGVEEHVELSPDGTQNMCNVAQQVEAAAHEESVWHAVKTHKMVIAISVVLTLAPFMDGFDTIAMNLCLSMPAFDHVFGVKVGSKYVIEATWQSAWAAMYQIGICFGALSSAQMSDRFGRRVALLTGCAISAAGVAVVFAAYSKAMFLVGKIINGFSIGILISTCQVYNSEIVPLKLRGPLLALFTFMQILGQLISVSIVHGRVAILTHMAYKLPFALEWIWPAAIASAVLLIPESPWHLIRAGKDEQAAKALRRLHGSTYDTAAQMALMRAMTQEEQAKRSSNAQVGLIACFRGTDRRRTLLACFIVLLQQAVGVVFYSNSSYFLLQAGMAADKSIMATEIGIALGLPANAISWFAMTRIGRRPLLLFSTGTVMCIMLAVGVAGTVPRTSASLWTLGGLLIVSPFFYNLGVGPVYPVLAAELPSTQLRAQTTSVSFFAFAFGSFSFNLFFPYMYNTTAGNLGGKSGYFFAGLSLICIIVIYFFVPETLGRSYAELDEIFDQRISARSSASYICRGTIAHTSSIRKSDVDYDSERAPRV